MLYETVAQETGGFTRDREGGDAEALAVDRVFTQAILAGGACRFLHGALDPLLPAGGTTECVGERARFISGAWHLLRCTTRGIRGEPPARDTGAQARPARRARFLPCRSSFGDEPQYSPDGGRPRAGPRGGDSAMDATGIHGPAGSVERALRGGGGRPRRAGVRAVRQPGRGPVSGPHDRGRAGRTLLRRLLGTNLDADLHQAAESTLVRLGEPSTASSEFTSRELDVLAEVRRGRRNKEIAGALGITDGGVRYHRKNIYRKTGVSSRLDAVRYATAARGRPAWGWSWSRGPERRRARCGWRRRAGCWRCTRRRTTRSAAGA